MLDKRKSRILIYWKLSLILLTLFREPIDKLVKIGFCVSFPNPVNYNRCPEEIEEKYSENVNIVRYYSMLS